MPAVGSSSLSAVYQKENFSLLGIFTVQIMYFKLKMVGSQLALSDLSVGEFSKSATDAINSVEKGLTLSGVSSGSSLVLVKNITNWVSADQQLQG